MNVTGRKFRSCVNGVGDEVLAIDMAQPYQNNTSPARSSFYFSSSRTCYGRGELVKTSEMNAAQPFDVININLLQPSGKSTALVVKEWDLIMDVMIQIKEAWPADEPQPGDDNMFDNRQVDLVHNGSHLMDTNLVCQRGINEGDTLLVLFSPLPAGPKRERGGLAAGLLLVRLLSKLPQDCSKEIHDSLLDISAMTSQVARDSPQPYTLI